MLASTSSGRPSSRDFLWQIEKNDRREEWKAIAKQLGEAEVKPMRKGRRKSIDIGEFHKFAYGEKKEEAAPKPEREMPTRAQIRRNSLLDNMLGKGNQYFRKTISCATK